MCSKKSGSCAPLGSVDRMATVTGNDVMEYRKLGGTDLRVSLLGYGSSPLGDVFGKTDPKEGMRAVHLAIDQGVNFFDVSPFYGLTLAEERLGQALAGKRQQILLATKCGRYGAADFDFSARRIGSSIDESLGRLRTDYVDLLQVHDVEFGDVRQIIEETIPALRKIQEQGKARFIGITGYSLKALAQIAEGVPVDTILSYCRYNLLVTDMDTSLTPLAKRKNIGLINASGLHMGILTEQGAPLWHPAPPEVLEAGRKVVAICGDHKVDIAKAALRFCFDHSYVSSTLVGMSTCKHVEANLSLLRMETDQDLVTEIRSTIAPVANYIWPSGRRENYG
jgi:L-galactose dehydrogenase